jgi:hypothetical protein
MNANSWVDGNWPILLFASVSNVERLESRFLIHADGNYLGDPHRTPKGHSLPYFDIIELSFMEMTMKISERADASFLHGKLRERGSSGSTLGAFRWFACASPPLKYKIASQTLGGFSYNKSFFPSSFQAPSNVCKIISNGFGSNL